VSAVAELPLRRALVALALAGAVLGAACARDDPKLTVFAASSCKARPSDDAKARFSFAGSQQLVAQIQAGAPADVVVTADQATMARLAGLVGQASVVAHNSLAIAVTKDNPKKIASLRDLARPGLTVVLADPSVPAGGYAKQVLDRAGVVVKPASLELDVESALQKVALGQADAAVVYETDALDGRVGDVHIPPEQNVQVTYWGAAVKRSRHRAEADAFVHEVARRLVKAGFDA
jgi:molybdate transport system substrate-binding protein